MDKFFQTQLETWVLNKLESNSIYGTSMGNPAIKQAYFEEVYNIHLPLECFSTLESISRRRNKLLEKRKDLDFRNKK